METIKINGKEIKKGLMTSEKTTIIIKEFPNLILTSVNAFYSTELTKSKDGQGSYKEADVSLTHNQIIHYINNCLKFETTPYGLLIETKEYIFKIQVQE